MNYDELVKALRDDNACLSIKTAHEAADAIEELANRWSMAKTLGDMVMPIPASDVRPVVTCGKCKYGKYTGTEWFCDKHSGHADKFGEDASYHEYHSKHWFCADGEARLCPECKSQIKKLIYGEETE